jgi:hypothetical protein
MVAFRSRHGRYEQMSRPVQADSGDGFYTQAELDSGPFMLSRTGPPLSGGFGSGHREAVVGEVGD